MEFDSVDFDIATKLNSANLQIYVVKTCIQTCSALWQIKITKLD